MWRRRRVVQERPPLVTAAPETAVESLRQAPDQESRKPTPHELLRAALGGMRQHPLQVGYNPFAAAREPRPLIVFGGGSYFRPEDVEAGQRVVDPARSGSEFAMKRSGSGRRRFHARSASTVGIGSGSDGEKLGSRALRRPDAG
jgi:hypothetical protein